MVRFLKEMNEVFSMKFHYKILIIFFVVLFLAGCRKNFVLSDKQQILFQYEHIDYSSGYTHEGFYIDDEGSIMTYKNPEGWNFHNKDHSIDENLISENISRCTISENKIGKEELARYSSYINNIASSKITALKGASADAGSTLYICYEFVEDIGMYKGSLIKMEGGQKRENLNFYSKKVSLWLRDINNTLLKE